MCLKKERISNQKTQKQTEQKFYGNLRSVAKSKTMAFRHTVESYVSNLVLLHVYNFFSQSLLWGNDDVFLLIFISGILVVSAPSSWMSSSTVHFGKADFVKVYFLLCHHYPILLRLNSRFLLPPLFSHTSFFPSTPFCPHLGSFLHESQFNRLLLFLT